MVEIRSFDEPPDRMKTFIRSVWQTAGEGRVATPLWSGEYLDWQFFDNPLAQRDYIIAAYDGDRIAGAFLAVDGQFRTESETLRGSWGSWLTVAPEYRSQFVAPQLVAEMCDRHRKRGASLILGYGYPTGMGMSIEFWEALARAAPDVVTIGPAVPTWVRVIDFRKAMQASLSTLDTLKYGVLGGVTAWRLNPTVEPAIRPFRPADTQGCLSLVEEATQRLAFTFVWDADRLRRQLYYDSVSETLVAQNGDRLEGFINFHWLGLTGREHLRIAIIDHLILRPNSVARVGGSLLRAAMNHMDAAGAAAAIVLQCPILPRWILLRSGFVPLHLGYRLVGVRPNPAYRHKWTKDAFMLLR
jgi:predicted N-acetyltransferase YhbS